MPRPRLDIRHLAMVEAVSRLGSISGAARVLGLTQPALSRQLQEAERRLGIGLFHREGKSMRPTVAGETIVQCARRVLSDLAHSERSAARIPEDPIVALRISLGHYDDYGWFPDFFKAVEQSDPQINLSVVNTGESDLQDALEQHLIDVAVVAGPVDKRRFAPISLFEDELVAAYPPKHEFTGREYLEAEDFAMQVYATYGVTYHKGFESDRVLLPAGIWPRRVISIGSSSAILRLVEMGEAITVLSSWIVRRLEQQGRIATARITQPGLPINWHAVVRRADGPRSPASRLAKLLQTWSGRTADKLATAT